MVRLPEDINREIIDYLVHDNVQDMCTLRSCNATSRSFSAVVKEHLFSDMYLLANPTLDQVWRFQTLREILGADPSIGLHVKKLRLGFRVREPPDKVPPSHQSRRYNKCYITLEDTMRPWIPSRAINLSLIVSDILSRLTHVQHLLFQSHPTRHPQTWVWDFPYWDRFDARLQDTIVHLIRRPTIQRVDISPIVDLPTHLLGEIGLNVEKLEVTALAGENPALRRDDGTKMAPLAKRPLASCSISGHTARATRDLCEDLFTAPHALFFLRNLVHFECDSTSWPHAHGGDSSVIQHILTNAPLRTCSLRAKDTEIGTPFDDNLILHMILNETSGSPSLDFSRTTTLTELTLSNRSSLPWITTTLQSFPPENMLRVLNLHLDMPNQEDHYLEDFDKELTQPIKYDDCRIFLHSGNARGWLGMQLHRGNLRGLGLANNVVVSSDPEIIHILGNAIMCELR